MVSLASEKKPSVTVLDIVVMCSETLKENIKLDAVKMATDRYLQMYSEAVFNSSCAVLMSSGEECNLL